MLESVLADMMNKVLYKQPPSPKVNLRIGFYLVSCVPNSLGRAGDGRRAEASQTLGAPRWSLGDREVEMLNIMIERLRTPSGAHDQG